MAWSPDGKTIALAEASLQIYDVATGKRLRTLFERKNPSPFYFRLSPDGQTVATIIGQQTILSSLDTGQVVAVLQEAGGWALDWSPDSKQLATTGPNGDLLIWSADGKTAAPSLAIRGRQFRGVVAGRQDVGFDIVR